MKNIRQNETQIITPIGGKTLKEEGDLTDSIKDVLYNPGGDSTLISVGKYLSDNENAAVIFTRKGAYEITMDEAKQIPYERKMAKFAENIYYCESTKMKPINHVEPENRVLNLHKRLMPTHSPILYILNP